MPRRPAPGDLIRIRPATNLAVEGQIFGVAQNNVLLAVFPKESSGRRQPILVAETMDTRLTSGEWEIFGNAAIEDPSPSLTVVPIGLDGQQWLQDFEGNLLRPATPQEISALRTRKSFSPAAVEEAILSLHGMADWNRAYDAMKVSAS
jgi:hypothetical protein